MNLRCLILLAGISIIAGPAALVGKEQPGQTIDSGSFGIFVNGQRVATENFSIQQTATGSTISSKLQDEGTNDKASQTSTMQLSATGDLVRYEWHELTPDKTDLELLPNDQFLIERVTLKPGEKPLEQPFLLPSSTIVLDNNFFVHRELLAWRYLAQNCKPEAGVMKCVSGPISFGVVVPQDRNSMRVTLQPVGHDKLQVGGSERELPRFELKFEDASWSLWLDAQDHFKIMKIAIEREKTEIVRD